MQMKMPGYRYISNTRFSFGDIVSAFRSVFKYERSLSLIENRNNWIRLIKREVFPHSLMKTKPRLEPIKSWIFFPMLLVQIIQLRKDLELFTQSKQTNYRIINISMPILWLKKMIVPYFSYLVWNKVWFLSVS